MMKGNAVTAARERLLSGIGVPSKSTFVVDDFQREAISNLENGIDTLVVAPTGSGKTHIAIEGMRAALKKRQQAVYTTPLKALSNTKYNEFQKIFAPDYSVGLLTGDRKIEGDSDIVISTTEIYRNELYRGKGKYSIVVLDEVHYIADPQRGAVWEESIILTPPTSTLLMLSASISNAEEIVAWIEEVRNKECRIVIKKERPVELRFAFLHPKWGIVPLSDERGHLFPEVSDYYGSSAIQDPSNRGGRVRVTRRGGERSDRGGSRSSRSGARGVRSQDGRSRAPKRRSSRS